MSFFCSGTDTIPHWSTVWDTKAEWRWLRLGSESQGKRTELLNMKWAGFINSECCKHPKSQKAHCWVISKAHAKFRVNLPNCSGAMWGRERHSWFYRRMLEYKASIYWSTFLCIFSKLTSYYLADYYSVEYFGIALH